MLSHRVFLRLHFSFKFFDLVFFFLKIISELISRMSYAHQILILLVVVIDKALNFNFELFLVSLSLRIQRLVFDVELFLLSLMEFFHLVVELFKTLGSLHINIDLVLHVG